jgi:hypothetical protein
MQVFIRAVSTLAEAARPAVRPVNFYIIAELVARATKDTAQRIALLYDPTNVMYTPPSTKTSAGNNQLAGAIRTNT